MKPPRFEKIVKDGVQSYRVHYLGMTRDFLKDYAALRFLRAPLSVLRFKSGEQKASIIPTNTRSLTQVFAIGSNAKMHKSFTSAIADAMRPIFITPVLNLFNFCP